MGGTSQSLSDGRDALGLSCKIRFCIKHAIRTSARAILKIEFAAALIRIKGETREGENIATVSIARKTIGTIVRHCSLNEASESDRFDLLFANAGAMPILLGCGDRRPRSLR